MKRRNFLKLLSAAVLALPLGLRHKPTTFRMGQPPNKNIWAGIVADPRFGTWDPEAKRQQVLRGQPRLGIVFDDVQHFSQAEIRVLRDYNPAILGPTPRS